MANENLTIVVGAQDHASPVLQGLAGKLTASMKSIEGASGRLSGAATSMAGAHGAAFNQMGGHVDGQIKRLDMLKLAYAGVAVGAVAVMGKLVGAAAEAEEAETKLAVAIENAGTGVSQSKLDKLADDLVDVGGADREAIKGMMAFLVSAKLSQDQVEKLAPAILDLSAFMGKDLEGASKAIAYALEKNTTKGFARLKIVVDEAKFALDPVGALFDAISSKCGGLYKAMGKDASGQMDIFNAKVLELEVALGTMLLPTLKLVVPLMNDLAKAATALSKVQGLSQVVSTIVIGGGALAGLGLIGPPIAKGIGGIVGTGRWLKGFATAGTGVGIGGRLAAGAARAGFGRAAVGAAGRLVTAAAPAAIGAGEGVLAAAAPAVEWGALASTTTGAAGWGAAAAAAAPAAVGATEAVGATAVLATATGLIPVLIPLVVAAVIATNLIGDAVQAHFEGQAKDIEDAPYTPEQQAFVDRLKARKENKARVLGGAGGYGGFTTDDRQAWADMSPEEQSQALAAMAAASQPDPAVTAYWDARGAAGKGFRGGAIPSWDKMTPAQRDAWMKDFSVGEREQLKAGYGVQGATPRDINGFPLPGYGPQPNIIPNAPARRSAFDTSQLVGRSGPGEVSNLRSSQAAPGRYNVQFDFVPNASDGLADDQTDYYLDDTSYTGEE